MKSTISENLSAIKADEGVSTIIPSGGTSTFKLFAILATNSFAFIKSSIVEIIGNMIFTLPNDLEFKIDFICVSNSSISSNNNLIPLTPRKGFSSEGKFR